MKQYVIIGGGVAGVSCIEGIRSRDPAGRITLISEEPVSNYGRPLISYYLEGKTDLSRMSYRGQDFTKETASTPFTGSGRKGCCRKSGRYCFQMAALSFMTSSASAPALFPLCRP